MKFSGLRAHLSPICELVAATEHMGRQYKILITEHGISPTLLLGSLPISLPGKRNGNKVRETK
jgi:hypothetical protein